MAAIKFIKRTVALDGSNITEQLPASFFNSESSAHTFIIAGERDGAAVAFTGNSVSAAFLNANDAVVSLTGSIVDGAAVVTLSNACYALSGRFTLTIDVNGATVYECQSRIKRRSSGTAYDPSGEISVAALSAEIAEMRTATAAANTAAQNANNAANQIQSELAARLELDAGDAIAIEENSDFNSFTTPGNYRVATLAVANTISNMPRQTSGRLIVLTTTYSARITQIYICNSNNMFIFYRFYDESWHDWIKFVSDVDLQNGIDAKVALATIRDIYPRISGQVSFRNNGSSIIVSVPDGLAHYLNADGTMTEKGFIGTDVTIPHDNFLIYNITNSAIEVKSLSQLRVLSGTNYIPLLYNSNGAAHGLWEKYHIRNLIPYQPDLYFYGTSTYPTFKTLSDYSIDVDIPNNCRVNYFNFAVRTPGFANGISPGIAAQTINVPHDKCLVFNVATNSLSVEDHITDYSPTKAILFYNSHGIVNGQWYRYYLLQLVHELQDGYPLQFKTHLVSKLDSINTMLSASGASAIVFVTDHHYPSNDMKSIGVVNEVCREAGITKVFLGGDYINRETQKAEALRNINRVAGMYEYPGVKTFRMCGNHEFNNPGNSSDPDIVANQLTGAELRHAILNPFIDHVTADPNSLSYYYDDNDKKIRYVVGSVRHTSALDNNSVKWVCSQLTQVPSGWSVVVLFHTILNYADGVVSPVNSAKNLINALDAFKQRSSYTFGGATYDFSSSNAKLICAICGDMHADTTYLTSGGVRVIATTTDSMQELGGLTRTTGDVTEIAFDVFIFNTVTKTIHCVRIGAGSDRVYSYNA